MKKTPKPEKNVISICAFLAILAATFTGFSLVAGGVNEIKVVPSQNSEQKAQKFNTTDLKRTDIGADRRDGYALTKTCARNSHLSVSSGLDTDRILFGASANPRDGANVFALDSKGNKIWNYLEPRNLTERTNNLVLTNDGGALLTGYIRLKKGWMSKKYDHMSRLKRLGNDGKIVWERSYDFQDDPRRKIVESSDGSFFLLKNYDSFPEIEGEGSKINLTRIDSRGDVVWDKTVLGHGFNKLTNMIALPDGGLLIAGYLFGGRST